MALLQNFVKEERQWYEEQRKEREERRKERQQRYEEEKKERQQLYEERRKEREEYWKKREQRDENSNKAIEDFKKECFVKIDATASSLERTVNKLDTNRFDDDKKSNQATSAEEETGNNSEDLKTGNQDATSAVNKEDNNTKELEDQEIEDLETEKEPLVDENSEPEIINDSPGNLIEIKEMETISDAQEGVESTLINKYEVLEEDKETCKKNAGIGETLKTCQVDAREQNEGIEVNVHESTAREVVCLNLRCLISLSIPQKTKVRLANEVSLVEGLHEKSPIHKNSLYEGNQINCYRDMPTKPILFVILNYEFYKGYMVLDHVQKGLTPWNGVNRES
nr:histone-lysine N-methyltransferase, H3 lysine-79 specific-like [Halyomorpha halys]